MQKNVQYSVIIRSRCHFWHVCLKKTQHRGLWVRSEGSVLPCGDQREIALTYISSVFHRSVASVSPRVCSRCDGCHGDDRRRDAPSGRLRRRLSLVADTLGLRRPLPARTRDSLNRRLCSGAHGDPDLSAPSACRGCAAGGWRGLWSSPSERGHGTRVWGSSLHPEFGSNLTRGKTESHIRHSKWNRTTAWQNPHV